MEEYSKLKREKLEVRAVQEEVDRYDETEGGVVLRFKGIHSANPLVGGRGR